MSISLDMGTTPKGTKVEANSMGEVVISTAKERIVMTMEDFAEMVVYTLVNTDLKPEDPRLALMERLRRIRVVEGYNGTRSTRLKVMGRPDEEPGGVIPR